MDLASARFSVLTGFCIDPIPGCFGRLSFDAGGGAEKLRSVAIRYRGRQDISASINSIFNGGSPGCYAVDGVTTALPGGNSEVQLTFPDGCTIDRLLVLQVFFGEDVGPNIQPFSVQYTFTNGIVSTAGFDGTGFSSTDPIALSVVDGAAFGPGGPAPADMQLGDPADLGVDPVVYARFLDAAVDVPAPGGAIMLPLAVMSWWRTRVTRPT